MSETKWTKGPWHLCGEDRGVCQCVTVTSRDHPVATMTKGDWGDEFLSLRFAEGSTTIEPKIEPYMEQITYGYVDEEEAKANARLIAAAPELYEALEQIASAVPHMSFLVSPDLVGAYRGDDGKMVQFALAEWLAATRAALAKARGDQPGGGHG